MKPFGKPVDWLQLGVEPEHDAEPVQSDDAEVEVLSAQLRAGTQAVVAGAEAFFGTKAQQTLLPQPELTPEATAQEMSASPVVHEDLQRPTTCGFAGSTGVGTQQCSAPKTHVLPKPHENVSGGAASASGFESGAASFVPGGESTSASLSTVPPVCASSPTHASKLDAIRRSDAPTATGCW